MILWPLLYSIPLFFNKIMWVNWAKPLQRFIDVRFFWSFYIFYQALYLRLKKEFEYDPSLKAQLEKNPEFIEFLHALEKVNACITQSTMTFFNKKPYLQIDRFLLGELFNMGEKDFLNEMESSQTFTRK